MASRFEWDDAKNDANERKHGIRFDEAHRLFDSGVDFLEIVDDASSALEERLIAIGPIRRGIVVVVWTERRHGAIRLISARWATRREVTLYHRHMSVR